MISIDACLIQDATEPNHYASAFGTGGAAAVFYLFLLTWFVHCEWRLPFAALTRRLAFLLRSDLFRAHLGVADIHLLLLHALLRPLPLGFADTTLLRNPF